MSRQHLHLRNYSQRQETAQFLFIPDYVDMNDQSTSLWNKPHNINFLTITWASSVFFWHRTSVDGVKFPSFTHSASLKADRMEKYHTTQDVNLKNITWNTHTPAVRVGSLSASRTAKLRGQCPSTSLHSERSLLALYSFKTINPENMSVRPWPISAALGKKSRFMCFKAQNKNPK